MVCPVSWSVFRRRLGSSPAEFLQAERHLLHAVLGLRLDGDVDHRHREGHALQNDRVVAGGQRVAGAGILQAHEGRDVAGEHFLDFLPLVGMHLEHPADPLAMILRGVLHHVALLERAGIDAHERQRAVFVVDDLERQAGERRGFGLAGITRRSSSMRSSTPSSAATLMPGTSIGEGR